MSIKSKLINEFILLKEIKVELSKFYDYIYQKKVKTTFPSLSSKAYFFLQPKEKHGQSYAASSVQSARNLQQEIHLVDCQLQ